MSRGIDVGKRYRDITKIVAAWYREPRTQSYLKARAREGRAARRIEVEDLVQDVALLIHRRNTTASAFDPERSSFSHYVRMCALNVVSHGTDRMDREALLDDPARWGAMSMANDNMSEAVRAFVSGREKELTKIARSIADDARRGQIRLFDVADEYPFLAAAAE